MAAQVQVGMSEREIAGESLWRCRVVYSGDSVASGVFLEAKYKPEQARFYNNHPKKMCI